ncbi:threonine--tRNA ligase, partial [Candidatus Woesearchaeota archaeon CG11_big_fil_rev_8_21_14_0_20_57_5]
MTQDKKSIVLEFPNGKTATVTAGTTAAMVIAEHFPEQEKTALAAKLGQHFIDLNRPLREGGAFKPITFATGEGKDVFWHSTNHVLAQAVKRLWPDTKLGIGPAIEEGFYYDFDREPFTPEELKRIEDEMRKIIKEGLSVQRKEYPKVQARKLLEQRGETYRLELIDEIDEETIPLYEQGEFIDMCRGPHLVNTRMIGAFKLLKVSGAYWRADARNKQLSRIYGISFPTKDELKAWLAQREEAERRDHRVLGGKLNLFMFDDISPGSPFFFQPGTTIYVELMTFLREEYRKRGYQEVITPLIYDKALWETSGHWDHYRENMFMCSMDGRDASMKPMNCPSHCIMYKHHFKSYRDLPVRIADFAPLHRNELKGVIGGLTRVRKFSQDDAHLFVTPEQLEPEILDLIGFLNFIYKDVFDFDYKVELSTRPEKSMGSEASWQKSELALKLALEKTGLAYTINEGDGAFYGPKIDFHIKDVIGRSWQLGTIQVDFNLPERFGLEYEDKDGERKTPIMVHRALLGSLERFIGILIEHYAGKFPLWLSPVQARIVTVNDEVLDYAAGVRKEL